MEKFVLVDGYISMDNSQLHIDINSLKKDVKERGGWLGVFFIFVGISTFHSYKEMELLKGFFHYFDFGLRILGVSVIIGVFWYLIFNKKSKKKLIINEIKSIEIDKQEFESEITIQFNDKREIDLSFRNLENQIEPFLSELKKRNSRIKFIEDK